MDLKYKAILIDLLPRGKFWPTEWISNLITATSYTFQTIEDHINDIFVNELPDNLDTYLGKWANILGLKSPTQIEIEAALNPTIGQSVYDYQALIDKIEDSNITIRYLKPLECGMNCRSLTSGIQWRFSVIFSGINEHQVNIFQNLVRPIQPAHLSFLYFTEEQWIEFQKMKAV